MGIGTPLISWSTLFTEGVLPAESGEQRTERHIHVSPRKPSFVGSAAKSFQPNCFSDVF